MKNEFFKRSFSFCIIYLGILLVLIGGLITHLFGEEGFIEIKEGQKINGYWVEDNLVRPLDFSLSLKDFSVEFYPGERKGIRFVKRFKSSVIINKDNKLLKEGIIEVNKPLGFGGFGFYQYGYDEDIPDQTVLQVVKDPGLVFAYTGYLVLLIGMISSFKRIWKFI